MATPNFMPTYDGDRDLEFLGLYDKGPVFLEPMLGTEPDQSMRYARQQDGTRIYIKAKRPT